MKNLFTLFICSIATHVLAQTPFSVRDSIDVNNINAMALVHGDMWWNPTTHVSHCSFPNGSAKNIVFAASLWLSAYDDAGKLHVAAQTYRQDGNDYWPGPLDGGGNLNFATSEQWAKIWKVTSSEISSFRSVAFHSTANTPAAILRWPGKGNAYAQGKDGAALDISTEMAPFVDLNGDGKYQPLKGEYPDIKGEQGLWWVFSDNGPTHSQSNGKPLKVEVQVLAYAYKRGTLIDDVVYYQYTILNRSTEDYHDVRLALWNSVSTNVFDDYYKAFDSVHRMGIKYRHWDVGSSGGPFNRYPHIVGFTFVSLPGDIGTDYVPDGSFMQYNNDPSNIGKPTLDVEFNNYMRSGWRNGVHLTNTNAGPGIPNNGYGPGPVCNYLFPGDPADASSWSECFSNNNVGEMSIVQSSNSFGLPNGGKSIVVLALVVDSVGGTCDTGDFSGIRRVADTAWAIYHNPPPPIFVPDVPANEKGLKLYPNPAHDELHIDCWNRATSIWVSIYNSLGQQVGARECRQNSDNIVDISKYPVGTYFVRYTVDGKTGKEVFVKD